MTRRKAAMIKSNGFDRVARIQVRRNTGYDTALLSKASSNVKRRQTVDGKPNLQRSIPKRKSTARRISSGASPIPSTSRSVALPQATFSPKQVSTINSMPNGLPAPIPSRSHYRTSGSVNIELPTTPPAAASSSSNGILVRHLYTPSPQTSEATTKSVVKSED